MRAGSGADDSGRLTPRLTPRSLTAAVSDVGEFDLTPFKVLAEKLLLLASFLLSESRASTLREISKQITSMVQEIEDSEEDDDLEWGSGHEEQEVQFTELKVACRQWKADALIVVGAEIQSLEERVSQIYTVFLD